MGNPTYKDHLKTVPVTQISGGKIQQTDTTIIEELILQIVVNGSWVFNVVFSRGKTRELAAGFLFTQGIIETRGDILSIEFDEQASRCTIELTPGAKARLSGGGMVRGSSGGTLGTSRRSQTPAQGRTIVPARPALSPMQIVDLMNLHFQYSELYKKTRAAHSAGLTDGNQMLAFFEDIGRHNALDKLAGHVLFTDTDTWDKVATLSCRMSLEIIEKIVRAGIPVVASNAVPTLSAVELAQTHGVTMIGITPAGQLNVYTCPERIIVGKS